MKLENHDNFECPSTEIAAYIDGELNIVDENELEKHIASCRKCSDELNHQKQFLCTLSLSLRQERDLDLPPNFAKLIVANAESTVSGLRRPRERFNALFICTGLMLFVLFALGTEISKFFGSVSLFFEQVVAIGGLFGRFAYSFFLGLSIILRSLASQFRFDVVFTIALTAIFAILLMFLSRRVLRIRGA